MDYNQKIYRNENREKIENRNLWSRSIESKLMDFFLCGVKKDMILSLILTNKYFFSVIWWNQSEAKTLGLKQRQDLKIEQGKFKDSNNIHESTRD